MLTYEQKVEYLKLIGEWDSLTASALGSTVTEFRENMLSGLPPEEVKKFSDSYSAWLKHYVSQNFDAKYPEFVAESFDLPNNFVE